MDLTSSILGFDFTVTSYTSFSEIITAAKLLFF
jgi:hypothetical protein